MLALGLNMRGCLSHQVILLSVRVVHAPHLYLRHAYTHHTQSGKPFMGMCLGLQVLFEGSEESGGREGLGLIKGKVRSGCALSVQY